MNYIKKNEFFLVIERRLFRYPLAISAGYSGMYLHMATCIHHNVQKLREIDNSVNLFGKDLWGYGINSISDGKEKFSQPDVEEVMKLPELNKHLKDYRLFWLLTFKVEKSLFLVSIFCIDTCKMAVNSNTHTRYDLKDFVDARLRTREGRVFVDIYFTGIEVPIYFQIDPYNNPVGTAKYYIDSLKELATKVNASSNGTGNDSKDDLNKSISEIESKTRELVVSTLTKKLGTDNFEKIITGNAKQQVRNRIKEYIKKHPGSSVDDFQSISKVVQFTDLDHLKKLITKHEYWEYFKSKFNDVDRTEKYFDQLAEVRNVLRHDREMSSIVMFEGKAAIEWFNSMFAVKVKKLKVTECIHKLEALTEEYVQQAEALRQSILKKSFEERLA